MESRFAGVNFTAKVHVLNSCAVTSEATAEVLRSARRLKRLDPSCKVVVTGCAAQVDTEKLASLADIDLIVANSHKTKIVELVEEHLRGAGERINKSNIFQKMELEEGGGVESHHTRSFLKIQDGCNAFCTFCVIPFARGKSRSIPIAGLVERVNQLQASGKLEVVLTGVHIGDYEDPTSGGRLEDLVEQLLAQTQIPRLRLSSLEPIELTDRLIDLYQNARLCPHFHMSIQSANTRVLAAMKRNYSAHDVEMSLNKIHAKLPDAFVGMDVIVGFPTETDEEFLNTYTMLERLPWTQIHVFPFSARDKTFAKRMSPKVEAQTIQDRARRLRELSFTRFWAAAEKMVGRTRQCVLLRDRRGEVLGHTRDNWKITIPTFGSQVGEMANVRITGYKERLIGVLVD